MSGPVFREIGRERYELRDEKILKIIFSACFIGKFFGMSQSSTQVVAHLFYLCKMYEYDYRGLMIMVVVGWTKTL